MAMFGFFIGGILERKDYLSASLTSPTQPM